MKKKLLVSVSGGRTSGLMAYLLWTRYREQYEFIFIFANTSREKEETLQFVKDLEEHFGMSIVWVEAVVHKGRKGCTHRVVNFETACRDGSVFEAVIAKYGIPNTQFLHCTRELKTNPIWSYAKSHGWGHHKQYTTAIGYRKDEPGRIKLKKAKIEKQYYPLYEWGITKADVLGFWRKQTFDLMLKGEHQGNCKDCHKKTDRKVMTQMQEDPNDTWIEEMEVKYENFTPDTRTECAPPYRFFRHNQTMQDLRDKMDANFIPYSDTLPPNLDFELDEVEYGGCAESCEPF